MAERTDENFEFVSALLQEDKSNTLSELAFHMAPVGCSRSTMHDNSRYSQTSKTFHLLSFMISYGTAKNVHSAATLHFL